MEKAFHKQAGHLTARRKREHGCCAVVYVLFTLSVNTSTLLCRHHWHGGADHHQNPCVATTPAEQQQTAQHTQGTEATHRQR